VVFTWTSVAEVDAYDYTLMDASGSEVDSQTGLTDTSYVYSGKFSYDTAYTWQVVALMDGKVISESAVSTFRTLTEAVPPPEFPETIIEFPEPPPTPTWVWVVIGLGAVLVIVVIVLIFRTRKV
ncbi:MAG: hypothetical protein KAX25_02560, partial [Dehalococcoidia bacterium]|nr:hypothetical protein [Dehalococcoidia bacterium]